MRFCFSIVSGVHVPSEQRAHREPTVKQSYSGNEMWVVFVFRVEYFDFLIFLDEAQNVWSIFGIMLLNI